jgi:hypothetical protein
VAFVAAPGCGGDKPANSPQPEVTANATTTPEPTTPATAAVTAAPSATAVASAPPPREEHPPETKILAWERSKDSLKVDKIGAKDGDFKPDGKKDVIFTLKVSGAVDAIYIASVDKNGDAAGVFQSDSLTGSDTQPNEFAGSRHGKTTEGVAVFEGDKLLNDASGSLKGKIGAGEHTLTLAIANNPKMKLPIRLWVQMPDHTMVAGPVISK